MSADDSMWWPDPRDGQARLTLLGSPHLHSPGHDAYGMDLDDPLDSTRQEQLRTVRDRLVRRSFDHVAVEVPATHQTALDQQYAAIRDGAAFTDEATVPDGPIPIRSETVQIGFRVADALDHERVHAVDSRPELPDIDANWEIEIDSDAVPYPVLDPDELVEAKQERIRTSTYGEMLREQNSPALLRRNQSLNVTAAMSSSGPDDYVGSTQLGYWYERNARIFENLRDVTGPDEETLFVVGASHVIPVKQLAQAAPATCPRSPLSLLTVDDTSATDSQP